MSNLWHRVRMKTKFLRLERAFARGDVEAVRAGLGDLCALDVNDALLAKTDPYLALLKHDRKLIATFDVNRRPRDDEIVIIFGNYPHDSRNIVVNNPIKRNLLDYWKFDFDEDESDPCWEEVDAIYVISLESRADRYYSALRELSRMGAPFRKVQRVPAVKGPAEHDGWIAGTIGCMKTHLLVVERALEAAHQHVLILEDDFTFTDEIEENRRKIRTFFERDYAYSICLLGTSKYGPIADVDDLVSASFQECTNAEAYFASRQGLSELREVFSEGLSRLIETQEERYAADRYWAKMQDGKTFLVFRDRLGMQAPSFSDIVGEVTMHMD